MATSAYPPNRRSKQSACEEDSDPDVMLPGHVTRIVTSGFSDSLLAERGLERGVVDSQLESYQATIFPT